MELYEIPLYVQNNLSKKISIKELARACYTCPTKLKIDTKKIFGESIGSYVTRVKMRAAADMLRKTKHIKIATLGEEMGYSNTSHFATAFRKVHGCLPSEFLQKEFRLNQLPCQACDAFSNLL